MNDACQLQGCIDLCQTASCGDQDVEAALQMPELMLHQTEHLNADVMLLFSLKSPLYCNAAVSTVVCIDMAPQYRCSTPGHASVWLMCLVDDRSKLHLSKVVSQHIVAVIAVGRCYGTKVYMMPPLKPLLTLIPAGLLLSLGKVL